ncbi:hypothetical protein P280DRAFT_469017 [Massarina eburnea CBS 473.64]|uniref:N-acetyltransferase domain-containing protein n=1 Tax=Massarina eburnea CBS 473.64 TaxID=1395130 RepID=A0A6A6S5G4_9PLEO|nr:hypothetical protein P280DRAFT_469017 [Massarina eburnea CBS 473.64]
MSTQPQLPTADTPPNFKPFIILTTRLLIVPTPLAIDSPSYISLYQSLHANQAFCEMGFGKEFLAVQWTEEQTREKIVGFDVGVSWAENELGDFGVALRHVNGKEVMEARVLDGLEEERKGLEVMIVESGEEVNRLISSPQWIGYAGVRDCTYSIPARLPSDPALPPLHERIELRYGIAPAHWGKGLASEAAKAVIQWAKTEKGVKRLLAETEGDNSRSARVLEKMGFVELEGNLFWKDGGQKEWGWWIG